MQQISIHQQENNIVSQQTLDTHKKKFHKQARVIFSEMMRGVSFTTKVAVTHYNILSFARRKKDLVDSGVQISERPGWNNDGTQVYFMTSENINYNKKFL